MAIIPASTKPAEGRERKKKEKKREKKKRESKTTMVWCGRDESTRLHKTVP